MNIDRRRNCRVMVVIFTRKLKDSAGAPNAGICGIYIQPRTTMKTAQSVHWNGHLLCAVDIETTGLNPEEHDLLEIAIVPLAPNLEISKVIPPFDMIVLPRDPDRYKRNEVLLRPNDTLADIMTKGSEWHVVADLIEIWKEKLNLPERKKIIPLGHNFRGFDEKFIRYVMGNDFYESIFDYHVRDTMELGLYLNDVADYLREPIPFPKVDLTYMCGCLRIQNIRRHRALGDAVATAELYRRLTTQVGPSLLTTSRLIQCPDGDLKSEREAQICLDDSLPKTRTLNPDSSQRQTPASEGTLPSPSPQS